MKLVPAEIESVWGPEPSSPTIGILSLISAVRGSMRRTAAALLLTAHTLPPAVARPSTGSGTDTLLTTSPESGSTRISRRPPASQTRRGRPARLRLPR